MIKKRVFWLLVSFIWIVIFISVLILSFNGVGINNDKTHQTLVTISDVFAGLALVALIIFSLIDPIFEHKKKNLLKTSRDKNINSLEEKIEKLKSVLKGCMSLFLGITIISVDFPLVITYILLSVSILLFIESFLK